MLKVNISSADIPLSENKYCGVNVWTTFMSYVEGQRTNISKDEHFEKDNVNLVILLITKKKKDWCFCGWIFPQALEYTK